MKTRFHKLVTGFALGVLVLLVVAASIDYRALNTTQFSNVSTVSIIAASKQTNSALYSGPSGSAVLAADVEVYSLYDSAGLPSLFWSGRTLVNVAGTDVLNWQTKTWSAGWIFLSITNHNDVSAGAFASGNVWGYDGLTTKWTNGPPRWIQSSTLLTNAITFVIDGGGAVIATNITRYLTIPYNCTVTGFTMLADTSTITVVDVMRCTYAEFDAGSTHPVIGDKITASLPPTINPSLYKTNVTSVGTWSASLTNGNVIAFRTITNTAATTITLSLKVEHAL